MDHSQMDHGHMDHGDMDHGDAQCTMSMLWNTNIDGVCLLHPSLRISSVASLIWYMFCIFILSALYEYLKARFRTANFSNGVQQLQQRTRRGSDVTPLMTRPDLRLSPKMRIKRSVFYVFNVAIAFILMLLIMTMNVYVIIAVLGGAFVGHVVWGNDMTAVEEGMACH